MHKHAIIQDIQSSKFISLCRSIFILRTCILLLVILAAIQVSAKEYVSLHKDNGVAILHIALDKGEKTYWAHSGRTSLPTQIEITKSTNLDDYYVDWPWPEFSQNLNSLNAEYRNSVDIPIYVKAQDYSKPVSVDFKFTYLICNDQGCFKKETDLSVTINEPKNIPEVNYFKNYEAYLENNKLIMEFEIANNETQDFVLVDEMNNLYLPDFIEFHENKCKLMFLGELVADTKSLSLFSSKRYKPIKFDSDKISKHTTQNSILFYITLAIAGGFILNLMPCVLPVLSMKLFHIVNSKTPKDRIEYSVISTFTIIFYFLVLAVFTLEAREIGQIFLPGFSMQQPSVIILCIIILTFMISVILDRVNFNIGLGFLSSVKSKNKYIEVIISTLVATILATPCTAPFLVTSITFAVTQSPFVIFAIFVSASIGFALPYISLILFPSSLNYIPKSGKWQKRLKFIFAIMLVCTVVWLVWLVNSLLGFYSALSVSMLIYLLRYCIECKSDMKLKIASFAIIMLGFLVIPSSVNRNFNKLDAIYNEHWMSFDENKIESLIKDDKVIFVNITADWCITCQINKVFVLDRSSTIKLFKNSQVYTFIGDITKENDIVTQFLLKKGITGIPFNIIYGPKNKDGIILPVILRYKDIENAIKLVKDS